MTTVKPITPGDIASTKLATFPEKVVECWNKLIAKHHDGRSSTVSQGEAVRELAKVMGCTMQHAFTEGWLDIEELYRAAGWKVEYDRPAYNENYEATFTFTKGKRR